MSSQPAWTVTPGLSDYAETLADMEQRVAAIRCGVADELIWLIEHPPLYTAGTSANAAELLEPNRFPVFSAGRGGRYTYHGPGQRVAYVMLDLSARGRDVRRFVAALENWIIDSLGEFGLRGRIVCGKVGVWVDTPAGPAKIAALGVRLRQWISFHGLAVNVSPDLSHFSGIVPCGLSEPVTSLHAMGVDISMAELDSVLQRNLNTMLKRVGSVL